MKLLQTEKKNYNNFLLENLNDCLMLTCLHLCSVNKQKQSTSQMELIFFISNFCLVLNVVCFLLGDSPAFKFYMPTFRNTLFHLHGQVGACRYTHLPVYEDGTDRLFRNVGI